MPCRPTKAKNQATRGQEEKKQKKKQEDSLLKNLLKPLWAKETCHICDEDHWTKDCPHKAEVKKLFKSSKTSAVLTDPFPNPETKSGC
jgi:hypothetical protein